MAQAEPLLVKPSAVFDKAAELLKNNRGIFIGESHDNALAWNFLVQYAADFKKMGVDTVYTELDMYSAAARQNGVDCRTSYSNANSIPSIMNSVDPQIMVLKASGLNIIGHDDVTDRTRFTSPSLYQIAVTGPALDRRDDFAKKLIERTQTGSKFIVYGGSDHSGNERKSDRPSGKGLDEKLGIPSIDFEMAAAPPSGRWAELKQLWNSLMNKDSLRVKMEDGKGAATYVVSTENPVAFLSLVTGVGKALQENAQKAQGSDACGFQPLLGTKTILNEEDINALILRMKKEKAPRTK